MKLYRAKIPTIATDILTRLVSEGDIEVDDHAEAQKDLESILNEYLRLEKEISDKAKDIIESRKLGAGQLGKAKQMIAEERGIGLGDEGVPWICNQMLEILMESQFIGEIFSDDARLRKKIQEILRRHMAVEDELDAEVRSRIKNLKENTDSWDVEYARVMQEIRRKRGLQN